MNKIETALQIRPLTWERADLERLLEIEQASFNHYDAYSLEDFERWFHYNPDLCLVAEMDGQIGGYVISRILPNYGDLASLAIHPAYRRKGLGQSLLQATCQRVREYGRHRINLEVRQTNAAGMDFWLRMGFVPFGIFTTFYDDGEDAIRMRLLLD